MFKKIIRMVLMVLGGIILGVLSAFLFGLIVMFLWNWLMPALFGLPTIGFWKAWGLVILIKSGHHEHDHIKHFHSHPSWKRKFKEKMEKHFNEHRSHISNPEESNSV